MIFVEDVLSDAFEVSSWSDASSHQVAWLLERSYTAGMKTAISIPDTIFRSAERLATRMKKSRSQVYAEAVEEYVARHDPDTVTEQINAVCDEVDTRPDPLLTEAARRILTRTEW